MAEPVDEVTFYNEASGVMEHPDDPKPVTASGCRARHKAIREGRVVAVPRDELAPTAEEQAEAAVEAEEVAKANAAAAEAKVKRAEARRPAREKAAAAAAAAAAPAEPEPEAPAEDPAAELMG